MGVRKDLDSKKVRFIYYLCDGDIVIYVGTSANPKSRYKTHLKRIKTDNALLYKYCRFKNIIPSLQIKAKLTGTYQNAEKLEIDHIHKNSDTVLNFYNNPNKENYYKQLEKVNG